MNMGIHVWQPYLSDNKEQFKRFGCFSVQSFEVPHDSESCVGYYIKVDGQKILYVTDFGYLPQSFKHIRLNHMLVECNYMKDLIDKKQAKYQHQMRGHCSLETLIEKVIGENMTSDLKNVLLLHMSSDACNPLQCIAEVQKVVEESVTVDYAKAGLKIELRNDDCPF